MKNTTKVLFASRHPMTESQKNDLVRIFGEVEVKTESILWQDINQVLDACDSCDLLIGVFPQTLATKIGFKYGSLLMQTELEGFSDSVCKKLSKIVTSKSVPKMAKDGETRIFEHDGFFNLKGEQL